MLAAASPDRRVRRSWPTGFEDEHDVDVTFSFGSSTDLAEQVADGAPGDVLATADETSMGLAEDGGVTGEVETFATNVLTIVVPPGNPAGIESPRRPRGPGVDWVRCADEVPCGKRSRWRRSPPTPVTAEPVSRGGGRQRRPRQVVSGEADAGLVYATRRRGGG